MRVHHVWAGAGTQSTIWVRGRIVSDGGSPQSGVPISLAVSEDSSFSSPLMFGPVETTDDGMASIRAVDLVPDRRYRYALEVDGTLQTEASGGFTTHPRFGEPATFEFAAMGDAGNPNTSGTVVDQVSDGDAFDAVNLLGQAPDLLFGIHLGDLHYRNIGDDVGMEPDPTLAAYRRAYDDNLTFNDALGLDARQGTLWRNLPITYLWDDHDFGPNDSDKTTEGRGAACLAYRERVPHYALPAGEGENPIYQSWQVGRVLFIGNDVRAERDPNDAPDGPDKSMLGTGQVQWMENLLAATQAEFLVWCMPDPFPRGLGQDSWNSFHNERDQLIELFRDLGWVDRMMVISADRHFLAVDSGQAWAQVDGQQGPPTYVCAPLDATPTASGTADQWDLGVLPANNQWATIRLADLGDHIDVTWTGWLGDDA